MHGVFYAAVEDDPLTSGPGSRVYASGVTSTIEGEDGKRRRMAFIGDAAYCAKCGCEGFIIGGAGVRANGRLIDRVNGGRLQAVGEDFVLCKCAENPQIIAEHGKKWRITNGSEAEQKAARVSVPVHLPVYDEQFVLKDGTRRLSNVRYRIVSNSGQVFTGTTNAAGETQRVLTQGSSMLRLQLEKQ